MNPEQALIDLLRQLSRSHFALMHAVFALEANVHLISISFEAGVAPTDADKKKWQEIRDQFQKHMQAVLLWRNQRHEY